MELITHSNCKADTKNKGYQEIMFFDWKIQLEKIHITRDLSDNTMIYQFDYLVKMIKGIVTLQREPKQQLFGFPKIHAKHFK